MKPIKIDIMPFGFSVSFKLDIKNYNKKILKSNLLELKKIIVAMAGPLTNFVIILLSTYVNIDFIRKDILIYSNALIMLYNLLPIYPLDGGRIVKSLIHFFQGGKIANIVTNKLANVTMIIVTFASSIGVFYYENIAIFLASSYLWWLVLKENKRYRLIIEAYEGVCDDKANI